MKNIKDEEFGDVKYLSKGSNCILYTSVRDSILVAVKMVKPNLPNSQAAKHELELEIQILSKIEHPNIITLYGYGERPRKFMIMEFLVGGTLEQLLKQQGTGSRFTRFRKGLPWQSVLNMAIDIASAVKFLHSDVHPDAMIIHRGSNFALFRSW